MWKQVLSPWLVVQLLLGLILVAVPTVFAGAISLAVTVPVYILVVALTLVREVSQSKRRQKDDLLRQLRVLLSDFSTLTQGAHGTSVWAILRDLRGNGQFQAQMDLTGNHQAGELLDERCQRLFTDAGILLRHVRQANGNTTDHELGSVVKDFGNLIVEYRRVVQALLRFLADTKGEKETIQEKAPFSVRVHRDLADEYDRFMDNARQVREELRQFAERDWLPDEHLGRFPRAPLWG